MYRVAITGANGFIGKWLVEEMLCNNIEVIALVRNRELLQERKGLKIITYNSDDYNKLKNEKKDIDAFFHLAWGGVSKKGRDDCTIQMANIQKSMEMLEYASEISAKMFIGIGTVSEYCFCENILDVNAQQTPNDMYGAAKVASRYLLEARARAVGIPFIWTILPSTFGEGRGTDNILSYTIVKLLKEEKPQYGALTQMWDFLYVKEVARALRYIFEKGKPQKTYGVGSGIYRPLRSYIEEVRDIIDESLPLGIGELPAMSEKVFSSCVSIYDLTKDTEYVPQINFREGIIKTIKYYKELLDQGKL